MKIDLTLEELEILAEDLDEHMDEIYDLCDVDDYQKRYDKEQELSKKLWDIYNKESK